MADYAQQKRSEEARKFNEEFREYLGLTSEDEIPEIFKNGRSNPEGVEALNQFRLYRLKKELEKIQELISEKVVYLEDNWTGKFLSYSS